MDKPVSSWHAEHEDFQYLLDLLERELATFRSAERPSYELMLDILTYLCHYPDEIHHPREDVAFSRLAGRHPGMDLVLSRLQQEHRVIAHAGKALASLLDDAVGGAMVRRSDIEAAADTYLVYYRAHIAVEERDILPRALALLTAEDWAAVASAVPASIETMERSAERYRALRQQIGRAASASAA